MAILATSSLGPVQCYGRLASETLAMQANALQLCRGATSDAPARCFTRARARGLLEIEALRLCTMATSEAPAACAERLAAAGTYATATIVAYCAELQWQIAEPPTRGSPACVETALARTTLGEDQAVVLCRGARSTGPVECFEWGEARLALMEHDLVQLCAEVVVVPPWFPW